MPAYSFKANINNQSSSLTLRRVDANACEGGYTDGWGSPPSTIPPGQTIAFQAESTGPLQGCKGYVKYEVGYVRFDNSFQSDGFICFFWDVPVLGNTSFKLLKFHQAIDCDCDGNMSSDDESTFGAPPLIFDFGANVGDGVPNDGHGHNNLDLFVVDQPGQAFQPLEPYKYSPFSHPTPTDWEGHWSSSGVDIVVSRITGDTVTIQLSDKGTSSPLTFTATLDLSKPTGIDIVKKPIEKLGTAIHQAFSPKSVTAIPVSTTITESPIHSPIATVPLVVQNVLHLQNDVVLTLMAVTDSTGASRGTSIHYQIISLLGKVSRDVEISRYTPPPR